MNDWLEEYGGTIVTIGIIVFFGWLFLSGLSNDSSSGDSTSSYKSSAVTEETTYEEEPAEFYGYECSDDCSGHEAGYDWADENYICDEYGSGDEYWNSNSDSFNEGVNAYIEENC